MFIKGLRLLRKRSLAVVAGLVTSVTVGGIAVAVTSDSFEYSEQQVGFYSISAHAMAPTPGLDAGTYMWFPSIIKVHENIPQQFACATAAVHLPDGAILTNMNVYYSSSGDVGRMNVSLQRLHLPSGAVVTISKRGDLPKTNELRTEIVLPIYENHQVVKNSAYAYGFLACMRPGDFFAGARIAYRYKKAGS